MTNVSAAAPLSPSSVSALALARFGGAAPSSTPLECLSLKVCLFTFHWTNGAVALSLRPRACDCVCGRSCEGRRKREAKEEEGFLNSEFDFSSSSSRSGNDVGEDGLSAG